MMEVRYGNKYVTIKKVTVSLKENIEDILLEYVGRRKAKYIATNLKNRIKNKNIVIVEIDENCYKFQIEKKWSIFGTRYIPKFVDYDLDMIIFDCLVEYGMMGVYAEKCAPLLYSLEEVPETSNEETGDTSQDEAGAEISET